ncbi:MAG: GNAT family N-acetyltransferase [Prevotella sp.]
MKSRIYYNRQAVLVVRHYNGFKDKISPHLMYHINTSDDLVSVNFMLASPRLYNEIIGIITVSIYEDGNYIHGLSISEKYRKRGYGNALVLMCEHFLSFCRRDFDNELNVELCSLKDWHQQWYMRHGYVKVGTQCKGKYVKLRKQIK